MGLLLGLFIHNYVLAVARFSSLGQQGQLHLYLIAAQGPTQDTQSLQNTYDQKHNKMNEIIDCFLPIDKQQNRTVNSICF